jgi:hypothetical protein
LVEQVVVLALQPVFMAVAGQTPIIAGTHAVSFVLTDLVFGLWSLVFGFGLWSLVFGLWFWSVASGPWS